MAKTKAQAKAAQKKLVASYAATIGAAVDVECDQSLRDFIMAALSDAGLSPQNQGNEITHLGYDGNGIRELSRTSVYLERKPYIRFPNGWRTPGIVGGYMTRATQEYENVNVLSVAAKIVRDFLSFGWPHEYGDLTGYQIGVCGKALAERVLGPSWLRNIEARMRDQPGFGNTATSIWKGDGEYLKEIYGATLESDKGFVIAKLKDRPKPPGKADIRITIAPRLLVPSIEGPWGRYKNATLTLKNLPQTLCDGLIGRSLKDIVAGLPDDPVFAETIATSSVTRLAGDGHRNIISFDEAIVPLFPEKEFQLKAA